jgi:hypothetical protein
MFTTAYLVIAFAMAVALSFSLKKNRELGRSVSELSDKVNKPFGLKALEAVGATVGGLTTAIVSTAYVVAAACERTNTVAVDVMDEQDLKASQIVRTENTISALQAKVRSSQEMLGSLGARAAALEAIGKLLPSE